MTVRITLAYDATHDVDEASGADAPVIAVVAADAATGLAATYRLHRGTILREVTLRDGSPAPLADAAAWSANAWTLSIRESPFGPRLSDGTNPGSRWGMERLASRVRREARRAAVVDSVLCWPSPPPAWAVWFEGVTEVLETGPWTDRLDHPSLVMALPADGAAVTRFVEAYRALAGTEAIVVREGSITLAPDYRDPRDAGAAIAPGLLNLAARNLAGRQLELAVRGSTVGFALGRAYRAATGHAARSRPETRGDVALVAEAALLARPPSTPATEGEALWLRRQRRVPAILAAAAAALGAAPRRRPPSLGRLPRPTLAEAVADFGPALLRLEDGGTPRPLRASGLREVCDDAPAAGALPGLGRENRVGLLTSHAERLLARLARYDGLLAEADDGTAILWFRDLTLALWLCDAGEARLRVVARSGDDPPTIEGLAAASGDRYLPGGAADLVDAAGAERVRELNQDLHLAMANPIGWSSVVVINEPGHVGSMSARFSKAGKSEDARLASSVLDLAAERHGIGLMAWTLRRHDLHPRLMTSYAPKATTVLEVPEQAPSALLRATANRRRAEARERVLAWLERDPGGNGLAEDLRRHWPQEGEGVTDALEGVA